MFGMGGDPVAAGLVESFNRPGGNATGFTLLTNLMEPKRLGLLREVAPGVAVVGALVNPNFGGLLVYGVSITEGYRQFGLYTANILKGAKPADLPVQQATKFEMIINLKTAKALNIQISDNLLSLADEVIE